MVNFIYSFIPISNIDVEVASFDTQLLKAKEFGKVLPEGVAYHQGLITLPESIKRGNKYNDAAFMGIMRWAFYNKLKEIYSLKDINVSLTFGYITKNIRIENNLPKDHFIDARCISKNPKAINEDNVFYVFKKVRCHNRQIHKNTINKGGVRKLNQAPYLVKDFRLFDKVKYNGKTCFIWGRRSSGSFLLKTLDGTTVKDGVSYKKLKLLEKRKTTLVEVQKINEKEINENLG